MPTKRTSEQSHSNSYPTPSSSSSSPSHTKRRRTNHHQHQNSNPTPPSQPSLSPPGMISIESNQKQSDLLQDLQDQLDKTKSELSQSLKINQSQNELIESVRSSLRCNICLETLDSPYTLLCGHIFCHKDLYAWFHRLPSDYDTELEFESDDSDFPNEDLELYTNGRGGRSRPSWVNGDDRHADRPSNDDPRPDPTNPQSSRPQAPRPSPYRKKKNLICPQCRTSVHSAPFQLYAIKEATDHLRHAEKQTTGSSDSTSQAPVDPPVRHDPEVHRDEKDLTWGNLFLGTTSVRRTVVRDLEDGVRRCSRCTWEIAADGICEGCGEIYSDADDSDDYDSDGSNERWERQSSQSNTSWHRRSSDRGGGNGSRSYGHDRYSGSSSESESSSSDSSEAPTARRRMERRVIESDESETGSLINHDRSDDGTQDHDRSGNESQDHGYESQDRSHESSDLGFDSESDGGSTVHDYDEHRRPSSGSSQYGSESDRYEGRDMRSSDSGSGSDSDSDY